MINPETGNCINAETEPEPKTCPEGQYLNPETNRCKKVAEEAEENPCPDGYERNPETNRCRKIQTVDDASEYPIEEIVPNTYDNPQIFTAIWAIIVLAVGAVAIIVFQFRQEIKKFFTHHIIRRRC